MNLLFVIDDAYVEQFKVVLYSIVQQMPNQAFQVYLMQKVLLKKDAEIRHFVEKLGMVYHPMVVGKDAFATAPTTDRYPDTIYYRLLAHEYLPATIDKILYLDADILCLNDFKKFYHMEMGQNCTLLLVTTKMVVFWIMSINFVSRILKWIPPISTQGFC